MGSYGIKALESDEGLDIIDYLEGCLPKKKTIKLEEIISYLKKDGFFSEDLSEIDFLYDNSAMAVAELYLEWVNNGKLNYKHSEDDKKFSFVDVTKILAENNSLDFLLRYLYEIRNEVENEQTEREIVELWKESDFWNEWKLHLDTLINGLEKQKK